jgi:peptidyl-prolyl cis-trans isomerase SurA
MKSQRIIGIAITLMLAVSAASTADRVILQGVLVRVNDRIVTISEFTERVRQELTQMPTQPNEEELHQFTEALLLETVNELVLLERATEKQVTVSDDMVDEAMANLRKENNLEDDEAWAQALESSNLSLELLRERYRRSILLQRAVQGEVRPVEITEEELKQQYDREKEKFKVPAKVELEQVFIADGDSSPADTARRAQSLVDRVRGGADLKAEAILAGSELQQLGAIPVEDCRPDLTRALEGLDDGGITDPLSVPGGVQIIRLVQRIPAGYQSFEEVAPMLRRQRSAEAYENQTRGLVEKLKQDYLVEVHEEYLDLVYANLGGA